MEADATMGSLETKTLLNLRGIELDLFRVRLMGVLNLTPDSFSDGGLYIGADVAINHARQMIAEGVDIVDIGGESTRPGAPQVSVEEEKRRVLPVLEALLPLGVPISIDTRKPEVAQEALALGAHLLNDISGLRNERMVELCARYKVPAVIMHMSTRDPATMQQHTDYHNVVEEVRDFLCAQANTALSAGVPQVVLDPGFGFGKQLQHNLELVRHLQQIVVLGHPVLLGASRKSSIGKLTGVEVASERVAGTLAMHLYGVERGASILRVHDVAAHRQALDVWEALRG